MHRLFAFTLIPLLACGGGTNTADGDASSGGPDTSSSASDPTTTAAATTSAATTTPGDTTAADTAADTTAATTGDPAFCWGWQGPDGAPFLDLHDKDGALLDGGVLPLECGGQGLFMFGLYPTFGGFTPPGDILDLQLIVDVEGFNNNPEGHFYSANPVGYYVSCEDVIGGVLGVLPIFPFDNLDDLSVLDGLPADVHVVMPTGDEPIAVDLSVTLSVVKQDGWEFCGG